MKRQNINDTFTLQIPDNFEILTEDDLRKMYRNVGDHNDLMGILFINLSGRNVNMVTCG